MQLRAVAAATGCPELAPDYYSAVGSPELEVDSNTIKDAAAGLQLSTIKRGQETGGERRSVPEIVRGVMRGGGWMQRDEEGTEGRWSIW